MLAFIGMAVASCDGHHPEPDMGMKVGDVLCTDGQDPVRKESASCFMSIPIRT